MGRGTSGVRGITLKATQLCLAWMITNGNGDLFVIIEKGESVPQFLSTQFKGRGGQGYAFTITTL